MSKIYDITILYMRSKLPELLLYPQVQMTNLITTMFKKPLAILTRNSKYFKINSNSKYHKQNEGG